MSLKNVCFFVFLSKKVWRVYQNYHFNVAVEGVSKLSFQCGSRDAKFCVSTVWLNKSLILNVLYIVADIETRHATSLLMAKSHFDTPSTIWLDKLLIFNVLYTIEDIETRHATSLLMAKSHFDTPSTLNTCQPRHIDRVLRRMAYTDPAVMTPMMTIAATMGTITLPPVMPSDDNAGK